MPKIRKTGRPGPCAQAHGRDVDALATQALSMLVARRNGGQGAHRAAHLRDLFDASIDADAGTVRAVVRDILRLGTPAETLVDLYIPEVARRLGAAWLADRLSFVEVSIGSARLQAIVRDMAGGEVHGDRRDGCRIAVVVPPEEDHTLGAIVLTAQLRRMSVFVTLHIREAPPEVAGRISASRPDAVMISASHVECVREIASLCTAARSVLPEHGRILLGGPILEHAEITAEATGVDHLVNDVADALAYCRGTAAVPVAAAVREAVR